MNDSRKIEHLKFSLQDAMYTERARNLVKVHLFTKDSTMNTSIDITIDPSPDLLDVDSLQDPRSLSRRSSLRASITSVDFSKTEFQLDVSN